MISKNTKIPPKKKERTEYFPIFSESSKLKNQRKLYSQSSLRENDQRLNTSPFPDPATPVIYCRLTRRSAGDTW